jgi:hypothetical protein
MSPDLDTITASPEAFRKVLLVDTDRGPRLLAEAADDWQAEDFRALDPAWVAVAKGTDSDAPRLAYLERPRGHSKTTDLAVAVTWALIASRRSIFGVAAAGDADQARLLRDSINRLVGLNGWLADLLEVQRDRVIHRVTGSELRILSADAATSYGLTPDFIVVDELTVWNDGNGQELWQSLFSAAAKRARCLLVIISNAGRGKGRSWQWAVREEARAGDGWYFSRLDGPVASWITAARLAQQERILPKPVYARLWLNQWQAGSGDALPESDIRRAIVHDGPLRVTVAPYGGAIAGLDLASTRDHAALVSVVLNLRTRKLRVACVDNWSPEQFGGQIPQEPIKSRILLLRTMLRLNTLFFDPHQCLRLAEELAREGFVMQPVKATGENLTRMATSVLEAFKDNAIELYAGGDGDLLISDLLDLQLAERSYGWRLDSARTATGHGDRATALALCLPDALLTATTFDPHAGCERVAGRACDV